MYNSRPNLMLGFHGCDESVRNQLTANPKSVKKVKKFLIGWVMAFMFGRIIMNEL
jgi:hypothetical protein